MGFITLLSPYSLSFSAVFFNGQLCLVLTCTNNSFYSIGSSSQDIKGLQPNKPNKNAFPHFSASPVLPSSGLSMATPSSSFSMCVLLSPCSIICFSQHFMVFLFLLIAVETVSSWLSGLHLGIFFCLHRCFSLELWPLLGFFTTAQHFLQQLCVSVLGPS